MPEQPRISGYEWSFFCECGGEVVSDNGYLERWTDGYESEARGSKGPIVDGDEYTCPFCGTVYSIEINTD